MLERIRTSGRIANKIDAMRQSASVRLNALNDTRLLIRELFGE